MGSINIVAGEYTENIVHFITHELDDTTLDDIEINREFQPISDLASEPLTTAVTISLGTTALIAITRLIERWMENKRQIETLKIVAEGFSVSDEAGKQLASLASKHAQVSIKYGLVTEPGKK